MTLYRAYSLTLTSPNGRGVFHLSRFADLRELLEYFRDQWCVRRPFEMCSHDPDARLVLDRVWLVDGFVCDRPTDFGAVPDQLSNSCASVLLGAL